MLWALDKALLLGRKWRVTSLETKLDIPTDLGNIEP